MDIAQGLLFLVFVIKSKAENSSKPPPIFAGGCLPNFFDLGPYGCFYIGNTSMSWDNAASWCQNLTKNGVPRIGLAEITSEDIQFMLSGLIIMHSNSPSMEFWLGAKNVVRRKYQPLFKIRFILMKFFNRAPGVIISVINFIIVKNS